MVKNKYIGLEWQYIGIYECNIQWNITKEQCNGKNCDVWYCTKLKTNLKLLSEHVYVDMYNILSWVKNKKKSS